MPDLADLKALIHDHEAKDTGLTVDIAMCMKTWLADELAELEAEKADVIAQYTGSMASPDTTEVDSAIAEKRAEVEAATITLHFKALTKPNYRELKRDHKFDENSTEDEDEAFLASLTAKCYQGVNWQGANFPPDQLSWSEAEEKFVSGEVDPIYAEVLLINRANKGRRPLSPKPSRMSRRS